MTEQVVNYNVTDAAINEMNKNYMALTITDLADKTQLDSVHEARMIVKGKRIDVEKKRKDLKADAIKWGKTVDGEAKRIFKLLEPIETHLSEEENKVINEKKRIKEEEERKEREIIQSRVDSFLKYDVPVSFIDVAQMTDEEFDTKIEITKTEFELKQKQKAEQEAAMKAEQERLEQMQKEQAKIKAEQEAAMKAERERLADIQRIQEAEMEKIENEKKAIEAEKRRLMDEERKAIEKEKERVESEKRKLIEAEKQKELAERKEKDSIEREAKEKEKAEQEAARVEALKPDKEKLKAYFESISEIPEPQLDTEEASSTLYAFRVILIEYIDELDSKIDV